MGMRKIVAIENGRALWWEISENCIFVGGFFNRFELNLKSAKVWERKEKSVLFINCWKNSGSPEEAKIVGFGGLKNMKKIGRSEW